VTEEEKKRRQQQADQQKKRQQQQAAAKARAQQQDAQAAEQAVANVEQEKPQEPLTKEELSYKQGVRTADQTFLPGKAVKVQTLDEVKANAIPAEEHQAKVDAFNEQEQRRAKEKEDAEWNTLVNDAHKRAGSKIVSVTADPMLEGTSFAENVEKMVNAGELDPSAQKGVTLANFEQSVDVAKVSSVRDLAYISASWEDDETTKAFIDMYAEHNGLNKEDLYYQVEVLSGGRAFDQPQSARGQAEKIGIYNDAGEALDLSSATPEQFWRAIELTPDEDDRDALLACYKRMYPQYYSKGMKPEFMDSAELTQTDYNARVNEMDTSFTVGYTEDNWLAYGDQYASLQSEYGENPRILAQMKRALAKSYEERTGRRAPSDDEMDALLAQAATEADADVQDGEEKKGVLSRLWDATGGAVIDGIKNTFKDDPAAPRATPDVDEVTESAAAAEGEAAAEAVAYAAGGGGGGGSASSYAANNPTPVPGVNPSEKAGADAAQLAAETVATVAESVGTPTSAGRVAQNAPVDAQEPAQVPDNLKLAYDPNMSDIDAFAAWQQGYAVDERNMANIKPLLSNPNAMGVLNTSGIYADIQQADGSRKLIESAQHYGYAISGAMSVLDNGSLPADMANVGRLELASIVNEIDTGVRLGTINVPNGANQYAYALAEDENLKARVQGIANLQKEADAAYTEQERLAKEAEDAMVEDIRKRVTSGQQVSAEELNMLSGRYSNEWVDLNDDDLYLEWKHRMGAGSTYYFSDDGAFWNSDSAAAEAGRNMRIAGRGYGDYKSALKYETESLLSEYATAAHSVGMTLEQYLSSAGIDDVGQVIDIAYNSMTARGNAYAKDTEAQAAMEGTAESIGAWNALGLGTRQGAESTVADMSQTLYMALDAEDYEFAVVDLRRDYTQKYGEEMAAIMYRSDLMAYADSGALSEDAKADLFEHMSRARNIFEIGYEIEPGFLEGLARKGYNAVQKDVERLESVAARLPESERVIWNTASSAAGSLTGMGTAAIVGGVSAPLLGGAAASVVGSTVAYGMPKFSESYDDNFRNKKMTPGMAAFMAFNEAAATVALNTGSTGTDMDALFNGTGYALYKKALQSGKLAPILGATARTFAERGLEEAGEELIEGGVGFGFDVLSAPAELIASGRPVTPSAIFRSALDAAHETDYSELFKELAAGAGMGFVMGGVFSLAGSAKAYGQAKRGAGMQAKYASVDLATQIADGKALFTEENAGKVYSALQKDLLDARFRKYIDSGHAAAQDQKATLAAVMMGTGEADRQSAAQYAQMAQEHSEKAEAAREASNTAQGRFWELRNRLTGGDLSAEVELESARMQWQKAETALAEAESSASKAMTNAQEAMSTWLSQCRAQAGQIKAWMLEEQANKIASMRQAAAEELARRYEAEEAERNALTTNLVQGDAGTQEQLALNKAATDANIQTAENVAAADDGRAYAEGALFSEEGFEENAEADNSDVDSMTDEELDNEFASLTTQIKDAESRVSSVTEQSEELGLDSDTQQALADQEVTPLKKRMGSIVERVTNRFNELFDGMMQAIEMDNDDAYEQLSAEYESVQARLMGMGVDTDALIAKQYGMTEADLAKADADMKAQEAEVEEKAENEKVEKVTASLARRMEKTAADIEMIQPAISYFRGTPLFINASQKENLLSADGTKTLSQFNFKHGTKLTDKAENGAMPLDGHALSDIAAEAAGTVDAESAHPEEELLRIMQTGKKLAADQREEKREAREIEEKKRKAKEKRKEEVSKLTAKEKAQAETDAKQDANAETDATQKANSAVDALVTSENAPTEIDEANAPSTPAQAQQQLSKKGKKLESNALRAVQKLADDLNLGFRIKSDARFQSADAQVGKGVAGYYKNGQRNAIVRSKIAGRLDVSGHEVGHGLQELMGMQSTQKMIDSWKKHFPNTGAYTPAQYDHEAFAEFFWRYLTGRDAAVAYTDSDTVDAFEYALRQNKKIRKAVLNAQRSVALYYNSSDTSAKIGANIVSTADANKKSSPFARTAEAWFVDDTAAVEDFQNVIRERIGEGHLPFDLNLRDTIRYNRRASSRAAQCIGEAMVDNNGVIIDESLTDVFSEIKGSDYDLYMRWWLARHSIDRDNRKGSKGQVFDENALSTKERTDFIAETELAHPEFERTNERFQKWRRRLMDTYLVETGLMGDPKKASALLDMLEQIYPYYAPTKRAGKGLGSAVSRGVTGQRKYAMHEATGSTEDIIDPFESFVGMVNGIVSMAAENDNKVKFAELYDAFGSRNPGEMGAGVGMFANEITQDMQKNAVDLTAMREKIEKMLDDIDTDPDVIMQISDIIGDEKVQYKGKGRVDMNNVISVRDADGNDRYFEIYNPEMFKLLSSVSGQGARDQKTLAQTASMLTRAMSMLTTGSNPVFGITNAMRDFQNSVNYGSWATSYIDGAAKWLATLKDVVTNSEVSQEYDRLGGGGWSQYDTRSKKSADRIKSEVFKGYNTKNIGSIGRMAGRAIWRVATMEDLNGWIEKTSRLAEYKYGKHDRTTAEGKIEAFLAAQDVTTDFARRGNSLLVRDLKSVVPFFNASLQGIYRNARQFTAQESDRAKVRLAKQITNTALASLLANSLLMEFLDDDEKEEFTYLNPDLTAKHMFLPNFAPDILGDASLIRIPLDQNPISYAVNAAVSNMVWKGETGDEFLVEMAALADVIMDNLNPVSSTILDPMVSVISNKNWYGSKIVPTYLEQENEMNQYTEDTPQVFVTASEVLDGFGVEISPMMLQYLAQQYTGYIGQTVLPALPSEKNKKGILTGMWNSLAATARNRVTSDPLKSNDMISMVYDSITDLTQVSKTGKKNVYRELSYLNPALSDRDRGRAIDEAYDLTHKGGALYDAKKELTELDDEIDMINADDKLSDERKQELIASIRREKIEIALDVKEIMDNYNVRYKYEGILPRWFAKQFYK